MLSRQTFLRTALVAGVAAIALSGCGMMRPSQKMQIFEASLSPSQEVPATASSATGSAEVMFNENTSMLSWKVTYSGLTGPATAAHIHGPAPMGQNAGVVIPFAGDMNAQPMQGEKAITPAQYADMAAGLYYVNIHTSRFPGGEIRGQLRKRM
jgi:CHRD domain